MWVIGILFILIWGIAEEIGLSISAKKYHNSPEYRYQQRLFQEMMKNTSLDNNNKKK